MSDTTRVTPADVVVKRGATVKFDKVGSRPRATGAITVTAIEPATK